MSAEGVEHALRRRRGERDRLAGDLLDLEQHPGHLLLKGAELRGESRRRWDEAQADIATVWWLFDAYRRVVDRAEEVAAGASRLGPAELAELTGLLTGRSVEMKVEDVPVERRSLVRPTAEWLSLDQVMARMDTAYQRGAQTLAAADAAWTVLAPRLNEAEAVRQAADGLAAELGAADPELEGFGGELLALRDEVRGDPLTFAGPGSPGLARLDRVVAGLADRRRALEQAVRVKEGYDARAGALAGRIAEVGAAEAGFLAACDVVLAKIDSPRLPGAPGQARTLNDRLAPLADLYARHEWTELAERMADLERAAAAALDQALEATRTVTGLIDRRDELRGRITAFRAKAVRLGRGEDPELGYLYRRAHDLLWTAPCDLRQATVAAAAYQRAIKEIGAGG